jgi:hypothetical protein
MKTKLLPVLSRFEKHQSGKSVPVYKLERVEIDENGKPIWEKQESKKL